MSQTERLMMRCSGAAFSVGVQIFSLDFSIGCTVDDLEQFITLIVIHYVFRLPSGVAIRTSLFPTHWARSRISDQVDSDCNSQREQAGWEASPSRYYIVLQLTNMLNRNTIVAWAEWSISGLCNYGNNISSIWSCEFEMRLWTPLWEIHYY